MYPQYPGYESSFMGEYGTFIFFAFLVLLVLWIIMPIAVFGIRSIVGTSLRELKRQNELLERIAKQLESTK